MSQQAGSSSAAVVGAPLSSSYTKYTSLPDVDTSAPDVYEYQGFSRDALRTGRQRSRKQRSEGDYDVESDSSSDESDRSAHDKHAGDGKTGASDDIDSTPLTRNDAAAKFNGATHLDGDSVDFSARLHKKRTTRKATRPRDAGIETSTYVIEGNFSRKQETVADRLRRLKFEASQLEEELNAEGVAGYNVDANSEQVDSGEVLNQLQVLQNQLANLSAPSADSYGAEAKASKEALRALLQQSKQSKATPATDKSAGAADPNAATRAPAAIETRAADLVQLEARLTELESTLGLEEALLDESKPVPRPVLSTLSRLEHQLSILSQPRHLDAISRRVKVLVTEMDRVHDVRRKLTSADPAASATTEASSTTATLTPAEVTKLQHLFDVSTRLEPLLPVIPSVLNRLQTLSEVHASAAQFGTTLDELQESSAERQQQEQEMVELLNKIEANMEENRRKVEANLESLQSRIEEVTARLERVQR